VVRDSIEGATFAKRCRELAGGGRERVNRVAAEMILGPGAIDVLG